MTTPIPGQPVRGSKTGIPIMALFDLLGRTWALGVIWQLQDGPLTFRDLQAKCESISPTILNARIKELKEADVVIHETGGYQLTPRGHTLVTLIRPFGDWSRQWAKEVFNFSERKTR